MIKFTIITSVLNNATGLAGTALSIKDQVYNNIQWIVADGGSSDSTLEIINKYSDCIDIWFSEPDDGIYDAWNKALKHISGDWVIFLGAGDVLSTPQSLLEMSKVLSRNFEKNSLVYGNVDFIDATGCVLFKQKEKKLDGWENGRPALPCHQSVFQRSSLFDENCFDVTYKIAADSKFLLTCSKKMEFFYVDVDVSKMELMGVSTNPKNVMKVVAELDRLMLELNIKPPAVHVLWFQLKSRLKQWLVNYYGVFRCVANTYRYITFRRKIY